MWDKTQQAHAHAEGWRMVTTINNGDTHPVWDIATHGPRFSTDQTATAGVIEAARTGSAFHQQALKLVIDSRVRATPKRKKK